MISLGMVWRALRLALAIVWLLYVGKDFRRLLREARYGHPKLGRMPALVVLAISALFAYWVLSALLGLVLAPLRA